MPSTSAYTSSLRTHTLIGAVYHSWFCDVDALKKWFGIKDGRCGTNCCCPAALLLLYCCFTAALLLLYCCFTAAYSCFTAALLLLYCCFTAALQLLYCCLQLLYCRPLTADERAVMAANIQVFILLTLLVQKYKYWR